MNVLIAPGSFKESLDATQVARNIRIGLRRASTQYHVHELPLADGGSGTAALLAAACKGTHVTCRVCGPLGKPVAAFYGWVPRMRTAIIELAQAAGVALVPPPKRNPYVTTTRGVGELILDALDRGSSEIILGVGDSATIDCGTGALSVLGIQFLDKDRNEVEHNCQGLIDLKRIDDSQCVPGVKENHITVAADVMNKLTGKQGAAVYARQKGATPAMMSRMNQALRNFRKVVRSQYEVDVDTIPGAGAAGGVPAAFHALLNAEVKAGFDLVAEAVHLEKRIKRADIVITGEGRIDKQSFCGKVVGNVVGLAGEYKKPVLLIAGSIAKDARIIERDGVTDYYSLARSGTVLTDTIKNATRLLQETGHTIGKALLKKMSLRGM